MGSAVVLLVAVVVVLVALVGYLVSTRARPEQSASTIAGGGRPQVEDGAAYRNHLAMARWIELQLGDDLVRTSVAEPEQQKARRLLSEFYGDDGER